jgi:hypothetical protein
MNELVATTPLTTVTILQKKVMLVLPWYKSTNPQTAFCVGQLMDKRRTASLLNFGDAFVVHSRNSCADHFLQSSLEYMLTIDDDMLVPFGNPQWYNAHTGFDLTEPFASFNTIDRLISHGKSLVGALYFGRYKNANPMYNEGAATKEEAAFARRAPHNLLKPTRWVGTGCMLIHRRVFEDIEKKFPKLARGSDGKGGNWFTSTEHGLADRVDRVRSMLAEGPMTGEKCLKAYELLEAASAAAKNNSSLGMGEDVAFCIRAKEAGHQPYVDFGLVCGHIGQVCYGPKNTFPK